MYTNAPAERVSKLLIKERPIPPAPRMMTVKPGFKPAFIEQVPRVTGPLRGVAIAARAPVQGGVTPALAVSAAPTSYDELIREIAARYGVEYALVKAVIKAESDFNRLAVSSKGAQGLMQLMPATAAMHQVQNVFLPRDNIEGGCRHLRMLLDRYGGNLPSRSPPTMLAPGGSRRRAASRRSSKRASISLGSCVTDPPTCGRTALASRPVAEVVARGTSLAALPNLLTLLRIGLVPVLVVLLLYPTPAARAGAAACFLLACVTDFLDGWLARRHGITTALGQLLDPLADKLIVVAALIMLAAVPPEPRVPG